MDFRETWSQLSWKLTVTSQAWMVTILQERQPPSLVFAYKPRICTAEMAGEASPMCMDNKRNRDPVMRKSCTCEGPGWSFMRAGGKQRRRTFKLWKGRRIGHKEVNNDRNWRGGEVVHLLSLMIQNECLTYKQTSAGHSTMSTGVPIATCFQSELSTGTYLKLQARTAGNIRAN